MDDDLASDTENEKLINKNTKKQKKNQIKQKKEI